MQEQDLPDVCDVLRACFHWLADREGFTPQQREFLVGERSSEATVRSEWQSRPHRVATLDERVVALLVIRDHEIARLYVHPDVHRRGIGRRLFAAAEDAIRSAGHHEMTVGALVESAAAFYRSMGMQPVQRVLWEPTIFGNREVTVLHKRL